MYRHMLMGTGRTVGVVTSVVALAASAFAGCDTNDAGPLSGEEWVLGSAVDGGVVVEVGDDTNVRWRFVHGGCGDVPECPSGPKLTGHDGCNDFTRSIRIDGAEVVWGDYWYSTLAGCQGGLHDTMSEFFRDESFRFVRRDDVLELTSADGQVELSLHPG